MLIDFKYEILFELNINIIYKLRDYFKTFNCSVYISKNTDDRKVNGKSLIGWLSLGLIKYDTIILYFDKNVNIKDVKNKLDLIERE